MFATSKSADAVYLSPTGDGVADAVDFDGTNDYLSRASDLIGNVDGKTFTFSCWVWPTNTDSWIMYDAGTASGLTCAATGANEYQIYAKNSSGTVILNFTVSGRQFSLYTANHIVASIDLANTSNRSVYVNDVLATVTWTTYTNDNIDFTRAAHGVGAYASGTSKLRGRLSHVFLAYEYVDLSVEANRRIFITADRKPA